MGVGIGESPTIKELHILLNLRALNARWCVVIEATLEYHAWRLVNWDLNGMTGPYVNPSQTFVIS